MPVWDFIPWDIRKAIWFAEAVMFLRVPDPDNAISIMLAVEHETVGQHQYFPPTSTCPGHFVGKHSDGGVILVDGAVSAVLAAGLWDGYPAGVLSTATDPRNQWIEDAGWLILNHYQALSAYVPPRVFLAGFSAGGAIVENIGGSNYDFLRDTPQEIITFGAPRPGGISVQTSLRPFPVVRYMNAEDWVPLLPPRAGAVSSMGLAYGIFRLNRMQAFVQPRGGLQLHLNGFLGARELPELAEVPSVTNFATSLLTQGTVPFSHHSMEEYYRRLRLQRDLYPANTHRVEPSVARERPDPLTTSERNRAAAAAAASIIHTGAVQQQGPLVIPAQRAFRAVREGRVWCVFLGDQKVCCAPIRRRAQGIAAVGNSFLRRLQRQAVVVPEILAAQFVAYLQEASDPNGEIKPTLNTKYPSA